jgi:hypothetical protein
VLPPLAPLLQPPPLTPTDDALTALAVKKEELPLVTGDKWYDVVSRRGVRPDAMKPLPDRWIEFARAHINTMTAILGDKTNSRCAVDYCTKAVGCAIDDALFTYAWRDTVEARRSAESIHKLTRCAIRFIVSMLKSNRCGTQCRPNLVAVLIKIFTEDAPFYACFDPPLSVTYDPSPVGESARINGPHGFGGFPRPVVEVSYWAYNLNLYYKVARLDSKSLHDNQFLALVMPVRSSTAAESKQEHKGGVDAYPTAERPNALMLRAVLHLFGCLCQSYPGHSAAETATSFLIAWRSQQGSRTTLLVSDEPSVSSALVVVSSSD